MKKLFSILLAVLIPAAAFGQATVSTGDFIFQKKASSGPYVLVPITPQANKVLGFDGSGVFGLQSGGSGAWGSITGTLSNQTDLQTALNAKESTLTFSTPLARSTNTISLPAASGSQDGYLSSADWTTFNGKQGAINSSTTLTMQGLAVSGTGGNGYIYLKNQTVAAAAIASGNVLYSDASGNPSWKDSGGTAHIVQGTNQALALGGFSSITGTLSAANGGTGITSLGTGVPAALGAATNGASGLVTLDASSKLPAVDGSQLTNISAAAESGQVIQMVSAVKSDTASVASTSFTSVMTCSITPRYSNSKIVVMFTGGWSCEANNWNTFAKITRGGTDLTNGIGDAAGSRVRAYIGTIHYNTYFYGMTPLAINVVDSPGVTTSVTYQLELACESAAHPAYLNRSGGDGNNASTSRGASTMVIYEIKQ